MLINKNHRNLANADIRSYAKEKGVKLWELAIRMNISEPTITRKLRVELSDADKAAMKKLIDKIAKEHTARAEIA